MSYKIFEKSFQIFELKFWKFGAEFQNLSPEFRIFCRKYIVHKKLMETVVLKFAGNLSFENFDEFSQAEF